MPSSGGFVPLEPTAEDVAAGLHPVKSPDGIVVRLTARQMDIMSMHPNEKLHIPEYEMATLGKLLMEASQANIDTILESWEEIPPDVPELVPEPFEYTPLAKSTCIRLITLLPDTDDGMLQIRLDEYDFNEHIPLYYCLSYSWNNPHASSNMFNYYRKFADDYREEILYPVACNGRLLYVRPNLYDALRQLPEAPSLQVKRWYNFDGETEKLNDLHVAAAEGDASLVKINLFRGAYINAKDSAGRTAIILATIKGHIEVIKILLQKGADPQLHDHKGQSCLDYALKHSQYQITDLLLTFDTSGAKPYKRKFRHLGRGVKVWIDFICINQMDVKEKNNQVGRMNQIYSHPHAKFVAVWLGKDDGHGALTVQAINKLFPAAASKVLGQSDIVPYREGSTEAYARVGIPCVSAREWISLAALYLRQNFTRLWCLQETVLQDEVVMYLGEHNIPWDEFLMVTEQLHILQLRFTVPPSTMFRPSYNHPIEAEAHLISELRMRRLLDRSSSTERADWFSDTNRFWRGENQPSQIPLLDMVLSTITMKCFDPRDHIYALVPMCKDHPDSPVIEVDYAKPYGELYTEVMRLMLHGVRNNKQPSLELVASIRDSSLKDFDDLPSWTLHFAQPGNSPFWQDHFAAAGAASETFDLEHSETGRSRELILLGKKIDIVQLMAKRRPGQETVSMFNFDETWPSLILALPQIYTHTGQSRTEVLWRTLCANVPAMDDVGRSRESTYSLNELTIASPAPGKYATEFRNQYCAMILAYAERASHVAMRMRNSPGGVLLQALMGLQLRQEADDSSPFAVNAPDEDELVNIRDTTLTGPYFADPAIQRALSDLEVIHQNDSANRSDCATPSPAQISAFIADPPFRVWRPSVASPGSFGGLKWDEEETASDAQAMDILPSGEDGFRAQFGRFNGGRRLFVTEQGRYLGLGPMSMQEGDEIWLLHGSRVPFLLRRVSEEEEKDVIEVNAHEGSARRTRTYFKLIGDLYVHGIMHGEAAEKGKWEEIVLV